jgi:histidinol dehydrogenase
MFYEQLLFFKNVICYYADTYQLFHHHSLQTNHDSPEHKAAATSSPVNINSYYHKMKVYQQACQEYSIVQQDRLLLLSQNESLSATLPRVYYRSTG